METFARAEIARQSMRSWRVLLNLSGCKGADLERWGVLGGVHLHAVTDPDIRVLPGEDRGGETWIVKAETQRSATAKVGREIRAAGFGGLVTINEIEER